MTSARDMVASAFALAYRNAGGRENPASFLSFGRPPFPDMNPRAIGTVRGALAFRRLHADEGRGTHEISENILADRHGIRKLPRSDLRLIAISAASLARAERRRLSIGGPGDPSWSLTAHPLVCAAIRHYRLEIDPNHDAPPLLHDEGAEPMAVNRKSSEDTLSTLTMVSGHVWCNSFTEKRTGMKISQRMGRNLVRIEIPDVNVPAVAVISMKGHLLQEIIDHPLFDLAPDLRVDRIINVDRTMKDRDGNYMKPRLIVQVVSRPAPLATAAADRDTSWMRLPTLHYADIDFVDI